MKTRLTLFCTLSILAACLLSSCSGLPNYGALGPHDIVTIDNLKDGWEEYDIYYNTWYTATPAAMMFDPRDNDTTLTGKSWTRVTEQDAVFELLRKVTGSYYLNRVWAIVGPEKQLLGYMITPTTQLYIKKIDDKTFNVSNLQVPPSGP